jgi:hypothetical protein
MRKDSASLNRITIPPVFSVYPAGSRSFKKVAILQEQPEHCHARCQQISDTTLPV